MKRDGPLLEVLPSHWVDVTRVGSIVPADDPEEVASTLLEAGGRTYALLELPGAVARIVAAARFDWERERAQSEEEGRLVALDAQGLPQRAEEPPPVSWDDSPWP